jgi:hypothetical protein
MLVLLYLFLPLLASRVEAVDKVDQEAFDQGTLVLLGEKVGGCTNVLSSVVDPDPE